MAVYLGLDSSTQSLTAVAIEVKDGERRVLLERSLRFDDEFPEYGTRNGVLPSDDPLVVHSSPLLWADALDRLLGLLVREGLPPRELRAIAGSGQQHGSVYLTGDVGRTLASLDPGRPLAGQLRGVFSRPTSPIWMDSSTRRQCEEIARGVGGDEEMARITGSRAFERFTGPQIRKFWEEDPEAYAKTERIHLVSSWLATLCAGRDAAMDPGDASGMNLMDLARREWSPKALDATAPGLREKLPEIREAWHVNGPISPFWVRRHGLEEGTRVVSWSGDNPCSLVGVGLIETGRVAISLGTSDTLFGYLPEPRVDPAGDGHAFGSPTGRYMSLICFKNGSLARDRVRKARGLDWEGFSAGLASTPAGCGGRILLPWFEPEITPTVLESGPRRYGGLTEGDPLEVRAVIEAQMMSMALHSRWMGVDFRTIHATGGAAGNREILRVLADVFDAEVYQFRVRNSAALGAALRAFHADRLADGVELSWQDVVRGFAEPVAESCIQPDRERVALYAELAEVYRACEEHALGRGSHPDPAIEAFRSRYGG